MPPDSLLHDRLRLEANLIAGISLETGRPNQRDQDAILICKDLPAHARQARQSLWELLKARKVEDLQEAGETILATLDLAIRVVGAFANRTQEPLRGVQAELEQIRQEHLDRWPWLTQEDLDKAREEAARGDTIDIDDAFPAIAGVSRAEWESKLEAYQQKKRSQGGT